MPSGAYAKKFCHVVETYSRKLKKSFSAEASEPGSRAVVTLEESDIYISGHKRPRSSEALPESRRNDCFRLSAIFCGEKRWPCTIDEVNTKVFTSKPEVFHGGCLIPRDGVQKSACLAVEPHCPLAYGWV